MPRTTEDAALTTKAARQRLPVQHEPHWRGIEAGLAVGYRKSTAGGGTWMARLRLNGRYTKGALGRADDALKPDGESVLDFAQAQAKATAWASRERRIVAGEEVRAAEKRAAYTVEAAMADYLTDYRARNGKAFKTTDTAIKAHILPKLGAVAVAKLTKTQVRDWHRGLALAPPRRRVSRKAAGAIRDIEKPMEARDPADATRARQATANRLLTILKAGMNFARADGKAECSPDAWALVKPYKGADAPRVRYLTAEEALRLVNACSGDFRDLVTGALLTG